MSAMRVPRSTAVHMSETVRAATVTAVSASISTPVRPFSLQVAVMSTAERSSSRVSSTFTEVRARAEARPRPREPPVMRMMRVFVMAQPCPAAQCASRTRTSGDRRSLASRERGAQDGGMQQLAEFLRKRREALQPADVGLPRGPRRRTPGLRREEVAALAGMSPDYPTRLKTARGPPHPADRQSAAYEK